MMGWIDLADAPRRLFEPLEEPELPYPSHECAECGRVHPWDTDCGEERRAEAEAEEQLA